MDKPLTTENSPMRQLLVNQIIIMRALRWLPQCPPSVVTRMDAAIVNSAKIIGGEE